MITANVPSNVSSKITKGGWSVTQACKTNKHLKQRRRRKPGYQCRADEDGSRNALSGRGWLDMECIEIAQMVSRDLWLPGANLYKTS